MLSMLYYSRVCVLDVLLEEVLHLHLAERVGVGLLDLRVCIDCFVMLFVCCAFLCLLFCMVFLTSADWGVGQNPLSLPFAEPCTDMHIYIYIYIHTYI